MYEVPFIQEVPDINTSPFLDTDELKMALLAQKGFRGLWRNGPCPVTSFPLEGFGEGGGGGVCFNGLIENDEKGASYEKNHTQFKTRVENHILLNSNWIECNTIHGIRIITRVISKSDEREALG